MSSYPPTIIWRHRRENLKKCSLTGLEIRSDFLFYRYPGPLPALSGYIMLTMDAPPLIPEDGANGFFIIDATWRYAERMFHQIAPEIKENLIFRSIPSYYQTAYPRRQDDCFDPARGLASIEAIYIAYFITKRPTEGLLNNYFWKDDFLSLNFTK